MSERLRAVVCAGGGGVGKTTTSAALGLALARAGKRTLVVTIDPARRLADAIGVQLGNEAQQVELPGAEDRLWALMPSPESGSRLFMKHLFQEHPDSLERLLENKLFLVLEDKLAGMTELVAMTLALKAAQSQSFEILVVDTAPSRYALDFLTYPPRLQRLMEGRAVRWLSSLVRGPEEKKGFVLSRWGRRRIEGAISRVLGESLLRDTTALFAEIGVVQERFAAIARGLGEVLLGPDARYLVVAAPTGAAQADAEFLYKRLGHIGANADGFVLNRASFEEDPWSPLEGLSPSIDEAIASLSEERRKRKEAASSLSEVLSRHRRTLQVPLPYLYQNDPVAIVTHLADALAPHLEGLCAVK